jgi:hypothetical protein
MKKYIVRLAVFIVASLFCLGPAWAENNNQMPDFNLSQASVDRVNSRPEGSGGFQRSYNYNAYRPSAGDSLSSPAKNSGSYANVAAAAIRNNAATPQTVQSAQPQQKTHDREAGRQSPSALAKPTAPHRPSQVSSRQPSGTGGASKASVNRQSPSASAKHAAVPDRPSKASPNRPLSPSGKKAEDGVIIKEVISRVEFAAPIPKFQLIRKAPLSSGGRSGWGQFKLVDMRGREIGTRANPLRLDSPGAYVIQRTYLPPGGGKPWTGQIQPLNRQPSGSGNRIIATEHSFRTYLNKATGRNLVYLSKRFI